MTGQEPCGLLGLKTNGLRTDHYFWGRREWEQALLYLQHFGSAVVYTQGTRAHKTAWGERWATFLEMRFSSGLMHVLFFGGNNLCNNSFIMKRQDLFVESTTSIYFPMAPLTQFVSAVFAVQESYVVISQTHLSPQKICLFPLQPFVGLSCNSLFSWYWALLLIYFNHNVD